jgi:hypothetical protein
VRPREAHQRRGRHAGQAAEQIQPVGAQVVPAPHQPAGGLPDRHEGERGHQEDHGQEQVSGGAFGQRGRHADAHGELLAKRHAADADQVGVGKAVTQRQQHDELPAEQWNHRRQRNAVASRQRVAKTQPGEATQQAEVLVEREELEYRALPADHRQFEEQADRGGREDRQIDVARRQGIEPLGLGGERGVECGGDAAAAGEHQCRGQRGRDSGDQVRPRRPWRRLPGRNDDGKATHQTRDDRHRQAADDNQRGHPHERNRQFHEIILSATRRSLL